MVQSAGKQITGGELGEQAGYAKGARDVAPVLGSAGLRRRQVNRSAIWGWRAGPNDDEASTYEVPVETAQLFEKTLDRARPEWRNSAN